MMRVPSTARERSLDVNLVFKRKNEDFYKTQLKHEELDATLGKLFNILI